MHLFSNIGHNGQQVTKHHAMAKYTQQVCYKESVISWLIFCNANTKLRHDVFSNTDGNRSRKKTWKTTNLVHIIFTCSITQQFVTTQWRFFQLCILFEISCPDPKGKLLQERDTMCGFTCSTLMNSHEPCSMVLSVDMGRDFLK